MEENIEQEGNLKAELSPLDEGQSGKISEEEKLKLINETAKAVKEANKAAYDADQKDVNDEKVMLVAFEVGNEHYAVSIDMIKEVVSCPPIAPVPQVPKYVLGVANVRGNVLAILDLAIKFGLKEDGDKGKFVFVVKSEEQHFAISSKSVPNTMMVSKKNIGLASNIISQSTLGLNYVKGIIKEDGKMIVWIDLLEMVTGEKLATS
ncbi:MAG: chemotaxis protein CheW [Reichenbachiella sp.]